MTRDIFVDSKEGSLLAKTIYLLPYDYASPIVKKLSYSQVKYQLFCTIERQSYLNQLSNFSSCKVAPCLKYSQFYRELNVDELFESLLPVL